MAPQAVEAEIDAVTERVARFVNVARSSVANGTCSELGLSSSWQGCVAAFCDGGINVLFRHMPGRVGRPHGAPMGRRESPRQL